MFVERPVDLAMLIAVRVLSPVSIQMFIPASRRNDRVSKISS